MKIFVIHGEDEVKSYARLSKFIDTAKTRSWEVVRLSTNDLSFSEALSAGSLFSKEKFFVLTDIKKLGKKEIEWLRKKSEKLDGNLIVYHPGNIPVSLIKSLGPSAKVEEFKLPKFVFSFLETITPGSAKAAISLFHELIATQPPEFIFSLLARQVRDLYWTKTDAQSLPYPEWRIGKLKTQSGKFSLDQLTRLIQKLSEVDVLVKSSSSELAPSLDLVLVTQLE